jgi:CRP-like cAMP-binding protein
MGSMDAQLRESEIHAALRVGVPLFEGLPEPGFSEALSLARHEQRPKGATLFSQGDPPDTFFLILAGRIRVSQITPEGEQVTIRYLGPRDIAGCVAVCGGMPYPATAWAVEDTWLLTWSRSRVAGLAERYPELALNAMRVMGGRMTELQERLKELHTSRVDRRIANALGRLVLQSGRRTADGIEIDFPLSRQDLAEMTGTTLHTVSRTLSGWEQQGIVASGRQKVTILRPHALVAISHDLPVEDEDPEGDGGPGAA